MAKLSFRRKRKRIGFASSFGFIMAAAGSAVGLGNLWGFPYKTADGGGAAFVLVYIACVLLIGVVTMLAEIHIGKRAQANPVSAYKKVGKGFGWLGLLAVVVPFFITCYYSVLGGWTVKYAMNSFSGNTGIIATFSVNTLEVILYTAIFIILALVVIGAGVEGGIEKMSKVLMPSLFAILVGIVIYSLCLGDGVSEGLAFYLKPDFSKLTFQNVLKAMGQAFWSLSLGMGIMITYGSYTGKEINPIKATGMICLFDTIVALLAGLAIFPAVAHFDPTLLEKASGVGLIFNILPQVFDSMGFIGSIVSFFFFSMVVIAALTSIISLFEVCTQFVIQKFHFPRKSAIFTVAIICFVITIPVGMSLGRVAILEEPGISIFGMDLLTFFDAVTNTVLMPLCALAGCIIVGWAIKPKKAFEEIEADGTKVSGWIKGIYPVFVKFITPAAILLVEVFGIMDLLDPEKAGAMHQANICVIIAAVALVLISVIVYFVFFANTETGTNVDEHIAREEYEPENLDQEFEAVEE